MFQLPILTILISLLFCLDNNVATDVDQCENGISLPITTDILHCDVPPCPLIRGQSLTANLTFLSPRYIDALTVDATAYALGAVVQYPLKDQADGCAHLLNTRCPLEKDEFVLYRLEMFVDEIFPKVSLNIKLSLSDQNNNTVICISVDCVVV